MGVGKLRPWNGTNRQATVGNHFLQEEERKSTDHLYKIGQGSLLRAKVPEGQGQLEMGPQGVPALLNLIIRKGQEWA